MSDITPTLKRKIFIKDIEIAVKQHPRAVDGNSPLLPLKHTFADGVYVRDLTIPKNSLVVGKIHKHKTVNILLKGEITVLTEDGVKRLKAPMYFTAPAGSKKVGFTHEDTVWLNIHPTKETDLVKIEEEVITKQSFIDVEIEENKILELAKESVWVG